MMAISKFQLSFIGIQIMIGTAFESVKDFHCSRINLSSVRHELFGTLRAQPYDRRVYSEKIVSL
jgi:hypothetical protein